MTLKLYSKGGKLKSKDILHYSINRTIMYELLIYDLSVDYELLESLPLFFITFQLSTLRSPAQCRHSNWFVEQ